MANAKKRCSECKSYHPPEKMIKTNQGHFCDMDCVRAKQDKGRSKSFAKSKERKNEAPTVDQEAEWFNMIKWYVRQCGAFPVGASTEYQFHHAIGRKGKLNRLEVGRWFVLPVSKEFHDVHSNNELNITHHKEAYQKEYGTESQQFASMVEMIREQFVTLPFDNEILEAIEGY